jgi:hypothetical protein
MRSLSRQLIESGYRTRRRDTFFCSAKRKYPKKRRLDCRFFLRSSVLSGVGREGFLPSYRRAASMPRPFGLIPTKPAVLGAANEREAMLLSKVNNYRHYNSDNLYQACANVIANPSYETIHF